MSTKPNSRIDPHQPAIYQIRLKGRLGAQWASLFSEMTITWEENGDTCVTGLVVDQAALHGLLRKVRDVGIPLLSVVCIESDQGDERNVKQ